MSVLYQLLEFKYKKALTLLTFLKLNLKSFWIDLLKTAISVYGTVVKNIQRKFYVGIPLSNEYKKNISTIYISAFTTKYVLIICLSTYLY